jgi:malate dehydrogenase (oxaloacetate-decarboxylating)
VGRQAILDGLALVADEAELDREIAANFWEPAYVRYQLIAGSQQQR